MEVLKTTSTENKLRYLQETKSQIKDAITTMGQPVEDTDTFRSYPQKILDIQSVNPEEIEKLSQRIDANISNFDEQDVQIPKQFKHTNANLEEALNNINIDDDTLGNVFLTGSNGFVGIHVLYELLNTTNNTIYCLVRGRSY